MRIRKRIASLAVTLVLVAVMLPVTASAATNGNTVSSQGGVTHLSGVVTITQADVENYSSARDFYLAQLGIRAQFNPVSQSVVTVKQTGAYAKCSYCSKRTYYDGRPQHEKIDTKYVWVVFDHNFSDLSPNQPVFSQPTNFGKKDTIDLNFASRTVLASGGTISETVKLNLLNPFGPYTYNCPCGKEYSYYNYGTTQTESVIQKLTIKDVAVPDPVTELVFDGVNFTGSDKVDTTEDSNYNWALWLVNQNLNDSSIRLTFKNCYGTIDVGNNNLDRISVVGGRLRMKGAGNPYAYLHPSIGKVDIALDASAYVEFPTNYSDTSITATPGRYYKYNTANQQIVNNDFRGSGTWGLWVRYYNEFDGSQEPANGQLWIDSAVAHDINVGTAAGTRSAQYRTSGSITLGNEANYQMQSLFQAAGPVTVGGLQLSQASVVSSTSITASGTRGSGNISTGFTAPKLSMQSLNYSSASDGTVTFTTTSAAGESVIRKSTLPGLGIVAAANDTVLFESNTVNGVGSITANSGSVVNINNCVTKGKLSTRGSGEVVIDGGTYSGSPAVSGSNITVKRGTFTDTSGTSQFLIDPDSESTVTTDGGKTITTVKLSNPPIIIDWDDFPGIDLDIDLSAPTIEVIRNPSDSRTPTNKVTLTIRCQDPNGADDPLPLSINGGAFQASPATYTVTENQVVSIVARDANGNVREYQATISNIDAYAPEVTGFTQSTESWTKDPVRVYCNATDDVKLHLTPYKFEFHPNSGAATVTTAWQADRSYQVTENGTLYCYVRDSLGKETKSDPYYIRNIDNVAPTATYTISPPEGTKASPTEGVTIELSVINTGDPVTEDGSALATAMVKWNQAEAWSSDTARTVYENGVYSIQVRDSVGNVSPVIPITVNNISTDKPVIDSFTGTHLDADYVMAPVTLTVEAHGSGGTDLAPKAYSWDGGNVWTSLNTQKIYANGEYTVMVRDEASAVVPASSLTITVYSPLA